MDAITTELAALLASVRLRLEPDGDGWVIGYERERHPVQGLPLDGVDEGARRAELLAVAAAVEAAVKYPAETDATNFRQGAANLLPKVERARFPRAYDAVVAGRGGADGERLFTLPFGPDLVVAFVRDEGWRFSYVATEQVARWGASPGTMLSAVRSNLYHKAEVSHRDDVVAFGDGYDAARAIIVDDVFYDRASAAGLRFAVPGRDRLLVGRDLSPAAAAEAHAASPYPLSPKVYVWKSGRVLEAP